MTSTRDSGIKLHPFCPFFIYHPHHLLLPMARSKRSHAQVETTQSETRHSVGVVDQGAVVDGRSPTPHAPSSAPSSNAAVATPSPPSTSVSADKSLLPCQCLL